MLCGRQNNNKIKHLHERCRRLIHNDKLASYEELLEKDGSVSIHHKNIQSLAIEMFKCSEVSPALALSFSILKRERTHSNAEKKNHLKMNRAHGRNH